MSHYACQPRRQNHSWYILLHLPNNATKIGRSIASSIAAGIAAHTTIVNVKPVGIKKYTPILLRDGNALLANRTMIQTSHVQIIYVTKTCQALGLKLRCNRAYIDVLALTLISSL